MFGSKNFVIIKLFGGLGNQMFQYVIAKLIAEKKNSQVLIDTSFYNDNNENLKNFPRYFSVGIFNNLLRVATKEEIYFFYILTTLEKLKKKLGLNYPKVYEELSFGFDPKVLNLQAPVYLKGYFQSHNYFSRREKFIQNIFKFPINELDERNEKIRLLIVSGISVSIHVRRGDYVADDKTKNFHGNCTMSYYKKAIAFFSSRLTNFNLVFFSDDIQWVQQEFKNFPNKNIFVPGNTEEDSWKDMYLMSLCNHNIIANSSFSWWAAWLNEHSDKIIIAPKKWFLDAEQEKNSKDLIPQKWIRL
ncbi:alpha-1,2-fucosyltransferase [Gillisia sp. Hel_I_86]|uniref:alpha-1,2-fucosyltransferase n=1 Tax=Gillisia sp. Hel_I_86 TaxID=1249981 RepID=UPI00119FD0ED|nr:alpha-1,2-fucosyltransferase [Gillisia sp. Hel_I_86]